MGTKRGVSISTLTSDYFLIECSVWLFHITMHARNLCWKVYRTKDDN